MPSTAAQVIVSIIPIVGIVMGCTVIFFYLLWNYRLKKEMIQKGIYSRTPFDMETFSLLAGLILFILGLILVFFFLVKDGFSYGVLSGLIPAAIGFSLLIYVRIIFKIKSNNE
ncbi:MAG TPA: hypothetical protein PK358_15335 [Spirochaetota bacterium]|nr:hypothetical protein [Spirochaetota bacterium]HPJ36213.1 hypothetical protein [Spirochaetota bacterium]